MAIVGKERLKPQDIKSIKVRVSQMVFDIACGKMQNPHTGLEGKFSTQYCLANALLRGDTGLRAFTDEKVNDPNIRDFMKKISLSMDLGLRGLETIVELEANSSAVHIKTEDVMKNIPELVVKKDKVKNKYIDVCSSVLGESKTKDLIELIYSLDKLDNMKRFAEQTGV